MCLGIPGRVLSIPDGYYGQIALVDVAGASRNINLGLLEPGEVGPGDWIVIHMGFAMERTDSAGAEQAMQGLELMGRSRGAGEDERAGA